MSSAPAQGCSAGVTQDMTQASASSSSQSSRGQYQGILIKTSFQPQWWAFCLLIAERGAVQLAGAPFPSPELGTPAPSTRTGFQSKDMYRARGERSSPSLGGKKEHFLLLGRGGNQAESLLLPSWRAKVGKDSQQPGQAVGRALAPAPRCLGAGGSAGG